MRKNLYVVMFCSFFLSTWALCTSMVFVKEYSVYVKNFSEDTTPVAAIDISTCYLLEISNRDESTNKRTAFALAHFTRAGLSHGDSATLRSIMGDIRRRFEEAGGDVRSAKFRIFGGINNYERRSSLRKILHHAIKEGMVVEDAAIEEPKNHYMSGPSHVTDYVFYADCVAFCKMINRDAPAQDIFSANLKTEDEKLLFRKSIDDAYESIGELLDQQTEKMVKRMELAISEWESSNKPIPKDCIMNFVANDGIINL